MNVQESIQSITEMIDHIIQTAERLPEETIRRKPSMEEWSIMEVICHIEEATPYWLNELQQVVKSPGTEWGRGLQHEGRLAAVAQADQRNIQEVLDGIKKSKEYAHHILGSLHEDDLNIEAASRNPRFGTKPLAFIVEHLLVDHLATHLKQINRIIGQLT